MKCKRCRSLLLAVALLMTPLGLMAQHNPTDSYEHFAASGVFLDEPNGNTPALLRGGFMVDETTSKIVAVDFFHGTTELNILKTAGVDPSQPTIFQLTATNRQGDILALPLVAAFSNGLVGYRGGAICSDFFLFGSNFPQCGTPSTGGIAGAFTSHVTGPEADDLFIGVILDTGPVERQRGFEGPGRWEWRDLP
jgi:hypothetical protein